MLLCYLVGCCACQQELKSSWQILKNSCTDMDDSAKKKGEGLCNTSHFSYYLFEPSENQRKLSLRLLVNRINELCDIILMHFMLIV